MLENKEPFVSIVVPVYNAEETLTDSLHSLCTLEYPEELFEIIIVLDKSTDRTMDILNTFIDSIHLIENKKRMGVSESRNFGLSVAQGDYIAFVDSDCVVPHNWLVKLVEYLSSPNVAGVSSYHEPIIEGPLREHLLRMRSIQFSGDATKQIVVNKPQFPIEVDAISTNSSIFKKDILFEVGGFDKELISGEDIDLCWRIVERGYKLLLVPDSYISHRLKGNLKGFAKKQYWYGQGIPYLFMKHFKRMWLIVFLYIFVSLAFVDIYMAIFKNVFFAKMLFIVIPFIPLVKFIQEIDGEMGFSWNLEHIALNYLKILANMFGIMNSTFHIVCNYPKKWLWGGYILRIKR